MPRCNFNELFRSADFLVKHAHRHASICVVTFDSYADDRSLERDAFAEEFLEARGLSAIHIVNAANRWYQEPALEQVFAILRPTLAAYTRVVLYGSSMGGYAALRFADRLRGNLVIAISPQYTLAPQEVPFDPRWKKPARRVRWRKDLLLPLPPGPTSVVIYDPAHILDRRHVDLIAQDRPIVRVAVPYSGHPSGTYLAEGGLIVPLIMGLIGDTPDIDAILTAARRLRRQTPGYWMAHMIKVQTRSTAKAILIGKEALRLHPNVPYLRAQVAMLNLQACNFNAAVEFFDQAHQQAPGNQLIAHLRARALAAAGRLRQAMRVPRKNRPSALGLFIEWLYARMCLHSRRTDEHKRRFANASKIKRC